MSACSSVLDMGKKNVTVREHSPFLYESYARFRSSVVSDVRYDLSISLDTYNDQFKGKVTVYFDRYDETHSDLTLDFEQGYIEHVIVNGKKLEPDYDGWFISLPDNALRQGQNTVDISYRRTYANDGEGLHMFEDPESKNRYIFSQFEPYAANKMFPCFDQPDLKARYSLDVRAPTDWVVISSTRESETKKYEKYTHWVFPESALFSTYVFSLHAGPFHIWEDQFENVPLRLFSRQEIKKDVVIEDWFGPTKVMLTYFNDYFGLAYPFLKYDQVIVPDFNFGAMENVAAVTFTERFITRGQKTERSRKRLAMVIAHEAAHMWFGNIVTMRWWNDLWLNESFASYMSYLALYKTDLFPDIWHDFYLNMTLWAYETDQYITTHPVLAPTPSTENVISNIDGITYGKGASVLKQLSYFMGEETFRKSVRKYIQKHAYQNTQLDDFVSVLSNTSNYELDTWKASWLESAGLNSVNVSFDCQNQQLKTLNIYQHFPESFMLALPATVKEATPKNEPMLHEQRLQLAGYIFDQENTKQVWTLPVTYNGAQTDINVIDIYTCPDFIYPNFQDWAYIKIEHTQQSFNVLLSTIQLFNDTGMRLALWKSIWDGVINKRISLVKYVDFVLVKLEKEQDTQVIRTILQGLEHAYTLLVYVDTKESHIARARIEEHVIHLFEKAVSKSDKKRVFLGTLINVSHTSVGLTFLRQALDQNSMVLGMYLDQDLRWSIVRQLNRFEFLDYQILVQKEEEKDTSDRGRIAALVAKLIRPDKDEKRRWLSSLVDPSSILTASEWRSGMRYIFPVEQSHLKTELYAMLLDALPAISEHKNGVFLQRFGRYIMQGACSHESEEWIIHALAEQVAISLKNELLVQYQLNRQCMTVIH